MRTHRPGVVAAGLATVLMVLIAACGEPAEVGGVVLEREEEGDVMPAGDEEDRVAPAGDAANPSPEPVVLAAAEGALGVNLRFEDDGTEIGSGQVLERDPAEDRHLVADVLRSGDQVHCQAVLQAPSGRSLVARGELTLSLVLEGLDGQEERVTDVVTIDAEVAAGQRHEVATGTVRAVDTSVLRAVWCEAVHTPA